MKCYLNIYRSFGVQRALRVKSCMDLFTCFIFIINIPMRANQSVFNVHGNYILATCYNNYFD